MRLRSFRLRIALLSVALAGMALASFGLVAWRLIYLAKLNSLEAKLKGQMQRMVLARSSEWWETFGQELPSELGTQVNTPITLLAEDGEGRTVYSVSRAQLGSVNLNVSSLLGAPIDLSEEDVNKAFIRVFTQQTETERWLIGVLKSESGRGAIAVSIQTIDQDMATIRNMFLFAIPGTLLMIAGGAWVLAGSALRPVRKLTGAIQQVTAKGLDQQVPVGSADVEFVELIEVFNQMMLRLSRSFKQSSRFSGDAAHELKTPLAILQGELELAMQQVEPGSDLQQRLGTLLDEVSRLSTIVRKLLLLSLADAGQMSLRQDTVNLTQILAVLIEDIELMAPELPVKFELDEYLCVRGDRDLLTQVLQNLIDNAIKYNLPMGSAGQWLSVTGRRERNTVQVTVANASRGVAVEERDRIFDRFYRGDLSRNRKREGFGLGLSLSREIARAHRGELLLDETSKGETAFTLTLPVA